MPVGGLKIQPKKGSKFYPIPDDKYTVLITDVNMVKQMNTFQTPAVEEERLNFEFTVLDDAEYAYEDEKGQEVVENVRGRKLWLKVAPYLSQGGGRYKATKLYKLLCAVEGRDLGEDDLHELDPDTLIGQQINVFVEVNGEYNNVTATMPAREKLPVDGIKTVFDESDEDSEGKEADPKKVRPEVREQYNAVASPETTQVEDVSEQVDSRSDFEKSLGEPDEPAPKSRLIRKKQ